MTIRIERGKVFENEAPDFSKKCALLRTTVAVYNAPPITAFVVDALLRNFNGGSRGHMEITSAAVYHTQEEPEHVQHICIRILSQGELSVILDDFISRLESFLLDPLNLLEITDKPYAFPMRT